MMTRIGCRNACLFSWVALAFLVASAGSTEYLWDLEKDPYEGKNIASETQAQKDLETFRATFESLIPNIREADSYDTKDKDKLDDAYDICGGICPYVKNENSVDIEQKYSTDSAPNIVFVLVDDWGYNDLGYRSTYMNWATPTLDKLYKEGVSLTNYFTHTFCTPSRGALMTGRQAYRLGLQGVEDGVELPLDEFTIAQEMKSAGYRTYMVGKWHLGYSSNARTPTYRGFDEFYGYYNGFIDYWTKSYGNYLDLQEGVSLVTDEEETSAHYHAAFLFQSKVEEYIAKHAESYSDSPMFMYYAMQLVHFPFDVPQGYLDRCVDHVEASRAEDAQAYCGLNVMLDEAIANLTCALSSSGLGENTILVIAADNGGVDTVPGTSYPFRGYKYDYTRGGISTTAMISSPLLPDSAAGSEYGGLMHVSDWLPTLMHLATDGEWTGSYVDAELDGVDMWDAIVGGKVSPRTSIVHAVTDTTASLQLNMMKYDLNITLCDVGEPSLYFEEDLKSGHQYTCSNPGQLTASTSKEARTAAQAMEASESAQVESTLSEMASSLGIMAASFLIVGIVISLLAMQARYSVRSVVEKEKYREYVKVGP